MTACAAWLSSSTAFGSVLASRACISSPGVLKGLMEPGAGGGAASGLGVAAPGRRALAKRAVVPGVGRGGAAHRGGAGAGRRGGGGGGRRGWPTRASSSWPGDRCVGRRPRWRRAAASVTGRAWPAGPARETCFYARPRRGLLSRRRLLWSISCTRGSIESLDTRNWRTWSRTSGPTCSTWKFLRDELLFYFVRDENQFEADGAASWSRSTPDLDGHVRFKDAELPYQAGCVLLLALLTTAECKLTEWAGARTPLGLRGVVRKSGRLTSCWRRERALVTDAIARTDRQRHRARLGRVAMDDVASALRRT